ncbi:glutamate racemase [Serratia microhaemolytica]|uniref:glutamate racemase n=1 Tax=Serratia microhaemolytica TaxID=2675110 RepID=UPI000FDE9A8F|nr:glutamate racemase [Serratia microhaemolytica]
MATQNQEENTTLQAAIPSKRIATPRPSVLIFDSGVGGLSVYKEVRQLLPDVHYIYAFDNVAFPYGEKSEQFIIERVHQIISAVGALHPLSLVIIACNTASTVCLPILRARFSFPVVGAVPAIKPAAKLTANGIVGLLATRGTVQRSYTHELIQRFASNCRIELLGTSELVELTEAKLHGEAVPLEKLKKILQPWLSMPEPPDTIVLGCTHFPLLSEELKQVLPQGTRLVDSGAAIARRAAWLLAHQKNVHSTEAQGLAYCLALDTYAEALQPVLQGYGFSSLKELTL